MSRPRSLGIVASTALISLALVGCEAPREPPRPANLEWVDPPLPTHTPSNELPAAVHDGAGKDGSLLQAYVDRTPRDAADRDEWMLPFQAKTMVVELLIAAAKDDPEAVKVLLTDNARWGTPDRRELRARPIVSKDDPLGLDFLSAFRQAAARFGAKASFTCTPLQPGWQIYAASGAEPVWCSYTSTDKLDIIGFRLIMEKGQVKTDYVGFFPDRQQVAIRVPDSGDPPPLTPYLKRAVSLDLPDLMPDGSNPVIEKASKPRAAPKPEPEEQPIPVKPEPEPEPEPEPKPEPKPDAKPDAKPEPKPAKPEPKPDAKPEPKPKPKPEPKPDDGE